MQRKLIFLTVFAIVAAIQLAFVNPLFAESVSDPLLRSLANDDLEQFDRQLQSGADPNKIHGPKSEQWLMCDVTRTGREAFLLLAIKNGADVNLRNTHASLTNSLVASSQSAPLLCAIVFHNNAAVDILLENGASLDILACRDCKRFDGNPKIGALPVWNNATPITSAATLNEYSMAYKMIIAKKELISDELDKLVFQVENNPINQKSDENTWRLKIIDWLVANGRKVTPWDGINQKK